VEKNQWYCNVNMRRVISDEECGSSPYCKQAECSVRSSAIARGKANQKEVEKTMTPKENENAKPIPDKKTCPVCERTLTVNDANFYRGEDRADGFKANCKQCAKNLAAESRAKKRSAKKKTETPSSKASTVKDKAPEKTKEKKETPTPPAQNPISLEKLLKQAQELLTRRATVESEIVRLKKELDEMADPKRFIEENLHRV